MNVNFQIYLIVSIVYSTEFYYFSLKYIHIFWLVNYQRKLLWHQQGFCSCSQKTFQNIDFSSPAPVKTIPFVLANQASKMSRQIYSYFGRYCRSLWFYRLKFVGVSSGQQTLVYPQAKDIRLLFAWKTHEQGEMTREMPNFILAQKNSFQTFCPIQISSCLNSQQYLVSISMEQVYKPKCCAFHPKELIFNFCKNSQCLLPLCPSCIKIHTEEHRTEQTYGQFENIHKVTHDVHAFFDATTKELSTFCQEITDQKLLRAKEQQGVKKRIQEAKAKMLTIVQRFFTDFEKEVGKSILCYNQSMKESYDKVGEQITSIKNELAEKTQWLGNDKVLKVLIGFHAKEEEKRYNEQVDAIKERIQYLGTQKVDVVCQPAALQAVIEEMGTYIHLSFQNWQHQIKYVTDFIKSGFMSTGEGGFNAVKA